METEPNYIFEHEITIRKFIFQFESALNEERERLEKYQTGPGASEENKAYWQGKLNIYIEGFNVLKAIFERSIKTDQECLELRKRIAGAETTIKTLSAFLRVITAAKPLEIKIEAERKAQNLVKKLIGITKAEETKLMQVKTEVSSISEQEERRVA